MKHIVIVDGRPVTYVSGIHEAIPAHAIEVSDDKWSQIIAAHYNGAQVVIRDGEIHLLNHAGKPISDSAIRTAYHGDPAVLRTQAITQSEASAVDHVTRTYIAVGDPIPAVWTTYIKTLRACLQDPDMPIPQSPA